MGGRRRDRGRSTVVSSTSVGSDPRPVRPATSASTGTSGSGRRRPTCPIPGFAPPPGAVGEYNGKFMVQPARPAGRLVRHPGGPRPTHLPELLPARRAVGVLRPPAGPRRRRPVRPDDAPTRCAPSTCTSTPPDLGRGAGRRRPHAGLTADAAKVALARCGSTTSGAASCSTRSPGSPSTTRPGPSGRSSQAHADEIADRSGATRWSSSARARRTRPGSCSTRWPTPGRLSRFVPFDVSEETLRTAAASIAGEYRARRSGPSSGTSTATSA